MPFVVLKFLIIVALLFGNFILCSGENVNDSINGEFYNEENNNVGPGKPLFITPLIESGKIEEAKTKSFVKPFFKNINSYSGYLTVDKSYNSNLFFWFFKSENNWEKSPVTIWLQGGPGVSSLHGIFLEVGPYVLNNNKIKKRYYSWCKYSNIIFIDSPVGSGFSFTKSFAGYARNETIIGEHLYNAIKQFFILFSNLKNNDVFIAGESYAGKYVPTLGYTIHKYNLLKNDFFINLKGLLIGNGLVDTINMLNYGSYLYEIGLIDFNDKKLFDVYKNKIIYHIKKNHWSIATKLYDELIRGSSHTLFTNITGLEQRFNYVYDSYIIWTDAHNRLVTSNSFRRNIHVGNKTYHTPNKVALALNNDIVKSVMDLVKELLNNEYRITFYNGQLDVICAYPLTVNSLKNLKWIGSNDYSFAKRSSWKIGNNTVGYYKIAKNLIEVLVKNAGHLPTRDQPMYAYVLFNKFITNSSLSDNDIII